MAAFEASRTPVRRQALAIMAEEGTSVPIEAVVQLTDAAAELLSWQKASSWMLGTTHSAAVLASYIAKCVCCGGRTD